MTAQGKTCRSATTNPLDDGIDQYLGINRRGERHLPRASARHEKIHWSCHEGCRTFESLSPAQPGRAAMLAG